MLFEDEIQAKQTERDDTNITTTLLYFSDEELLRFKKLCKAGMIKEYGEERFGKGNISDLLLTALNQLYGTDNS